MNTSFEAIILFSLFILLIVAVFLCLKMNFSHKKIKEVIKIFFADLFSLIKEKKLRIFFIEIPIFLSVIIASIEQIGI